MNYFRTFRGDEKSFTGQTLKTLQSFTKEVNSMERIEISFRNGKKCTWDKTEFNDFNYDGKCIIIKKDDRLVGVYPVEALLSFVYFEK